MLAEYVGTHDERLFSEIVERYERMIWRACWRVMHQRQDAEAAAQNTWVVFFQKVARIHKGESPRHWLRSTALGEARNIRKKKGRRNGHGQLNGDLAQSCADAQHLETLEIIKAEVQRLPEAVRVPFVLYLIEGKTKRESAAPHVWTTDYASFDARLGLTFLA